MSTDRPAQASAIQGSGHGTNEPALWPIFICYRQADGLNAARRLHELLDQHEPGGPEGEPIRLDVYLDQTMPAIADWRELHKPYLEKARALIVVCSPGAKIDEGSEDWVHNEIRWWLSHRSSAPILIDPLRQGLRYVPTPISSRWPEIQRIPLVEAEWTNLPAAELEEKASALRRQIVGAILPSGAAIYVQELEAERTRARRLRHALFAMFVLFFLAGLAAFHAFQKSEIAAVSQRISQASLYDAKAASYFEEARRHEARWEAARQRQLEIQRALSAPSADEKPPIQLRRLNLSHESRQLDETMRELSAEAAVRRQQGYAHLKLAEDAWAALTRDGHGKAAASRTVPNAPYIFSIELIDAGGGESILIHYGAPDDTRLVMLNAGPIGAFKTSVRRRLESLKTQRFAGRPTPIELFIASDQDEHKTGGLQRLLYELSQVASASDRVAELRLAWVNIFASFGLRGSIRQLIGQLHIPQNAPFDHLVMRPDRGRAVHRLTDGRGEPLEVVVLGPERKHLSDLYDLSRKNDERIGEREPLAPAIETFPKEQFSRLSLSGDGPTLPQPPAAPKADRCVPSENARAQASVAANDSSIPNLASTVLLFRYRGKTFLHTGDSRADLILNALRASGLMKPGARARLDLLHLPHLGSNRNLTPEFLEYVTADEYLFTGDGTHGNPEIATIAALIAARPCEGFVMNFVNRDGVRLMKKPSRRDASANDSAATETHGERLDEFFANEEQYNPKYRRVFRATDHGSVIIDLLDRVTY